MGILEFVFGKGAPKDDTTPKQAYYLNDDDAKTFGNIEYMRSTKVVKRTFAKQKGKEHMESVRSISATKMTNLDNSETTSAPAAAAPTTFGQAPSWGSQASTTSTTSASTASNSAPKTESPKRNVSTGMDMFRNMAKDLRK